MGIGASIAITLLGGVMQANAARAAGKSQQALAEYNAQVAGLQADDALARGRETETLHRLNTKRLIGSQRAAFGASGVDINDVDSTPVNVFADTAELSELDAITIRTNAAREAWGYRAQAQNYQAQGRIARMEGDNKAIGALISAGGSVLYGKYGFGATTRGRGTG